MGRYLALIRTLAWRRCWWPGRSAGGLGPLPFAGSMLAFAVLVVVAGLGLASSTAAAYSLIGDLTPEGATTEAFAGRSWVGGKLGRVTQGLRVGQRRELP